MLYFESKYLNKVSKNNVKVAETLNSALSLFFPLGCAKLKPATRLYFLDDSDISVLAFLSGVLKLHDIHITPKMAKMTLKMAEMPQGYLVLIVSVVEIVVRHQTFSDWKNFLSLGKFEKPTKISDRFIKPITRNYFWKSQQRDLLSEMYKLPWYVRFVNIIYISKIILAETFNVFGCFSTLHCSFSGVILFYLKFRVSQADQKTVQ